MKKLSEVVNVKLTENEIITGALSKAKFESTHDFKKWSLELLHKLKYNDTNTNVKIVEGLIEKHKDNYTALTSEFVMAINEKKFARYDKFFQMAEKVYDDIPYEQLDNRKLVASALKKHGFPTDPLTVGEVIRLIQTEIAGDKVEERASIEGHEDYEGLKYAVMHQPPKGYFVKGKDSETKQIFKGNTQYFDTYEEAVEHANLEISGYLDESAEVNESYSREITKLKKEFSDALSKMTGTVVKDPKTLWVDLGMELGLIDNKSADKLFSTLQWESLNESFKGSHIINLSALEHYVKTEYEFDDKKTLNKLYEGLINNVYKYLRDQGLMQHKSEIDVYLRESLNESTSFRIKCKNEFDTKDLVEIINDFDLGIAVTGNDIIVTGTQGELKKAKKALLGVSIDHELINESKIVDVDVIDPKSRGLQRLLKNNNVKMEILTLDGQSGHPEVRLTGKRKDLETVLADDEYGWGDPDLADFIEEGNAFVVARAQTITDGELNESKTVDTELLISKIKEVIQFIEKNKELKKTWSASKIVELGVDLSRELREFDALVNETINEKLSWDNYLKNIGCDSKKFKNENSEEYEYFEAAYKKCENELKFEEEYLDDLQRIIN